MTMPRKILAVAASAFVLMAVVLVVLLGSASDEARSGGPASGQTARAVTQARIAELEQAARERPDEAEPLVLLAATRLQRVRETGDPAGYALADSALVAALKREPSSPAALTERGVLRLARHDFSGALSDGRRARKLAPQVVRPLGVIVDAYVELGRYEDAERALQQMVDLKPNLDSYARVAYYRELRGDLDGASFALALAASAGGPAAENVAFVQALLGEVELAQGRSGQARRAFQAALAGLPDHGPSRSGLADLDIAAGRLEPAIERLEAVVENLPTQKDLVTLAELQLVTGRTEDARRTLARVRVTQQREEDAGVDLDTERAAFEADHGDPRRGVELGRAAWAKTPNVRTADALGWALTRAGKPKEGLAYARRALRLGSRDPRPLYHAGMSARAAGRPEEARRFLDQALGANPAFSPLHARVARRALAEL